MAGLPVEFYYKICLNTRKLDAELLREGMSQSLSYFVLLCLLCCPTLVLAQTETNDAEVTAFERIWLYDGPNLTYTQQAEPLFPGVPVQIIERNSIGNWVRVQRFDASGAVAQDGWAISASLNLPPDLVYSAVPVSDLADAVPEAIRSQSQSQLLRVPIIPTLSEAMIAVFEQGQTLGNRADVITKVGDSLAASEQYISIFAGPEYTLGPYDYLEETLNFYAASTADESAAARVGLTSYVVFDPFWADDDLCEAGETPLQCELRRKQPSITFVLFGPNDVRVMDTDDFRGQINQLIDETLAAGVIPVLMTFSAHPEETFFWQSINFNLELVALAEERQVPLINLWAAAQPLPQFGLDEDRVHLTHTGFDELKYDTGHEWFYGISLQNLLVLRTLHDMRLSLGLG